MDKNKCIPLPYGRDSCQQINPLMYSCTQNCSDKKKTKKCKKKKKKGKCNKKKIGKKCKLTCGKCFTGN